METKYKHTQSGTWTIEMKVLAVHTLKELSNQKSGLGPVLQICVLTDTVSIFLAWPIGSQKVSVIFTDIVKLFFSFLRKSFFEQQECSPKQIAKSH